MAKKKEKKKAATASASAKQVKTRYVAPKRKAGKSKKTKPAARGR
jgi:hypothetical protein